MPQPDEIRALADGLAQVYADAWRRLMAEQQALLNGWYDLNRPARLARLRELQDLVKVLANTVDEQALRWTVTDLPAAYLLGAIAVTADVAGANLAGVDLDALAVLASDTYSNLLEATTGVRASSKTLIRQLAREHVGAKLVPGQTAVQAGRELARSLAGQGLTAVTYADGSRHGLAEYAQMVLRTKTAEAYSTGNLAGAAAAGVGWVEVFDGVDCGWASHDDTDKANGTVRAIADADAHRLAHPNCLRSFGARPDITSDAEAARARGGPTPAQNADQAAVAASRELAVARRAAAKAAGAKVDRRTAALLAKPGTRITSPAYARRIVAHQVRADLQSRLKSRTDKVTALRATADSLRTRARQTQLAAQDLRARAVRAEPALTKLNTSLADRFGGTPAGLDFRLKGLDSLMRKIDGDVGAGKGSPQQVAGSLFDVNRYTTVFPEGRYAASSQATLHALRGDGYQLNVKNYWNVDSNPYQGINVQAVSPGGDRFELQFHTPESLSVKEGALHQIYEKSRVETDAVKVAEYNAESFAVAAKIPVPSDVAEVR